MLLADNLTKSYPRHADAGPVLQGLNLAVGAGGVLSSRGAAVARGLLTGPEVWLADEPTGNLDADTGGDIVRLLRELSRDDGVTVVMVTHNLEMAAVTDRVVRMAHGRVVEEPPASFRPRLV